MQASWRELEHIGAWVYKPTNCFLAPSPQIITSHSGPSSGSWLACAPSTCRQEISRLSMSSGAWLGLLAERHAAPVGTLVGTCPQLHSFPTTLHPTRLCIVQHHAISGEQHAAAEDHPIQRVLTARQQRAVAAAVTAVVVRGTELVCSSWVVLVATRSRSRSGGVMVTSDSDCAACMCACVQPSHLPAHRSPVLPPYS